MILYPNEKHGDHPLRGHLTRMIHRHETTRPRSMQSAIGPSQIGNPCPRSLGFTLVQSDGEADSMPPSPRTDPLPAIVGTAMHSWLESAAATDNMIEQAINPGIPHRWVTELDVTITSRSGRIIPGHCDLYDTETHTVIDWKVLGATTIKKIKADGMSPTYRAQIMLYALGLEQSLEVAPKHVALALVPRNGPMGGVLLLVDDYDPEYAHAALDRLDAVEDTVASDGWGSLEAVPSDNCRYCPVPTSYCQEGEVWR